MQALPIKVIAFFALVTVVAANTPRTCYTCNGINCMRTTLNATQRCIDPLDYCVTVFDKFNVVRKGCSLEVPRELRHRCDMNTVECHKCNTDRCNDMGQVDYLCVQCDSRQDSNCASHPETLMPTRCSAPTAPNSYCYVKYEGSVTKRGCSIAVAEQEECFEDANCMLCLPGDIRGCNTVNFMRGTRARRL